MSYERAHRPTPVAGPLGIVVCGLIAVFTVTSAVDVREGPTYGRGSSVVRVAFITDPHVGMGSADYGQPGWAGEFRSGDPEDGNAQALRECVQWVNNNRASENIALVVVGGDLSHKGELAELQNAREILDGLDVPWVPVMGNHDVWPYLSVNDEAPKPRGDSFSTERYYDSMMTPVYDRLKAISDLGDSTVRNWERCSNRIWQYEWNEPEACYASFAEFAFDFAPPGESAAPFHFVFTDFNSREDARRYNKPGADPWANLHVQDFNDMAHSIRVNGYGGSCTVYDGVNFTPPCTTFATTGEPGDRIDLAALGWGGRISSVEFSQTGLNSVDLYEGAGGGPEGPRLHLDRTTGNDGDRDLRENGGWQWFADHMRGYANVGEENTVIFAHHPLSYVYDYGGTDGISCFSESEYHDICELLDGRRGAIAGWVSGHIWGHRDWYRGLIAHSWVVGTPPICRVYVGFDDGYISLLSFQYDPAPKDPPLKPDEIVVTPDPYDPTEQESVHVAFDVYGGGGLFSVQVRGDDGLVATLVDSATYTNGSYSLSWNGRDSAGCPVEPERLCHAVFYVDGELAADIPINIKGTLVEGGAVSGEWHAECNPFVIDGDISISAGETLRVQPGVRVMPRGDFGITVAGMLVAVGGSTNHVVFTPHRRLAPTLDSCSAGAWKGIRMSGSSAQCSLDYCTIEYAGGTADSAAVFCTDSAQLVMTNSVISHSSSRGYSADQVWNFNNSIHGDTFEYCASYPAALLAESVHSVVHSCTFRNNGTKGVAVAAGSGSGRSVRSTAEWLKCEPSAWRYDVISGDLDVRKASAGTCTLNVAPGVTVRFKQNHKLVLHDDDDSKGFLLADGAGDPITFTGLDTLDTYEFWNGISFDVGSHGYLNHCRVTHSGNKGLDVPFGADVSVHHSVIRQAGKGVSTTSNTFSVVGCTLSQCAYGLYVNDNTGNAYVTVDSTTFAGNTSYGLYTANDENVEATHCSFVGNNIPAAIRVDLVSTLMTGASFSGNTFKGIEVSGGTISSGTHVWPAIGDNYIYRCADDIHVIEDALLDNAQGRSKVGQRRPVPLSEARRAPGGPSDILDVGPVLEIGPGVTVEFAGNNHLKVGSGGALKALGFANAKINFRCYESGQYWGAIFFDDAEPSALRHCVLDSGGGSPSMDNAAVRCLECSPSITYCTFSNAHEDDETKGIRCAHSAVTPSHCMFVNCGRGLQYVMMSGTPTFDHCGFEGNHDGIYLDDDNTPINASYCNFIGNQHTGVDDSAGNVTVYARYSYWNNPNYPYGPHGGDTVLGPVDWEFASETPNEIMPPVDVAAKRPIEPIDTVVSDTALDLDVYGFVRNNYLDSLYKVAVTMTIGSGYQQTVLATMWGGESCLVNFPDCHLDAGTYLVRLSVSCAGDSNQSNDTIYDTLVIRHSIDAAALQVVQPGSPITVDDSIAPTALIANYSDSTRTLPVKFYIDAFLRDSIGVSVGPHETTQAVFSTRTFPADSHQVRFICCLPIDDDRQNDTVSAPVYVQPGKYWVAEDSPPYANARLCWDKGQYLYAAQRNGAGVRRYNTLTNDWSSVASPAVDTVFGIAYLKGSVYALGRASGTLTDNRQERQDRQVAYTQGESGKAKGLSNAKKADGDAQDAAGAGRGGAFTSALGIFRYVADEDSWVSATSCDTTLAPGNGSALVGDEAGGLYLIEGGSTRVLRYIVAADSWVSDTAPSVIDRWGAAAWGRGKLYVLADPLHVLALDPTAHQWDTIALDQADTAFGTALCADPVIDRLFAFCHRPEGGPVSMPPFRERSLWNSPAEWVSGAGGVADTAGAVLCFGSTQAYCLDGKGGFWRYRPLPLNDVAAVGFTLPDTIPLDSTVSNIGIVQNGYKVTLGFDVRLAIGGSYHPIEAASVAPQSWDTVAFTPAEFSPGTYPCTLTVSREGDSLAFNDTAVRTLVVRYRRDVEALSVLSPVGRIPYPDLITPSGSVRNNSDSALTGWVSMTIGSEYADSLQVVLPALAESTIVFDTCHVRIGEYQPVLRVHYAGDEVPGNDTAMSSLEIIDGDYWKVLAQCPDNEVWLVGSPDSELYSVERTGTSFRCYDAAEDTWKDKTASPLTSNLSLCRHGTKVFALGTLGDAFDASGASGLGRGPQPPAGNDALLGLGNGLHDDRTQSVSAPVRDVKNVRRGLTDGPAAIVRYDVNSEVWDTVVTPLPLGVSDGSCLFATDDSTLFVLGDANNGLWRYSITQNNWDEMASMPGQVSSWASGAYDNDGHFYVLTDYIGKLRRYSVAGNSWDSLAPLNHGTPSGSALCCDPGGNRLFALWAEGAPGAYCYDIAENTWTGIQPYPSTLSLPALSQSGGNPFGQNGVTFAKYVPEPELDVAADSIIIPEGEERYDSAVVPTGQVINASQVPVWCQATFKVGSQTRQSPALYLAPSATDQVVFDSMLLPPGKVTATFYVTCNGDANHSNDTCRKTVLVEAPWEPRQAPAFAKGRLDGDTGVAVYAAGSDMPSVLKYQVAQDSWLQLPNAPFIVGTADLSHYNGILYALGAVETDRPGDGRPGPAGKGSTVLTTTPAIFRMTGDTAWTLVTDSLPDVPDLAAAWIVATADGIYLVPGQTQEFYRYDTLNGWQAVSSVPRPVQAPLALDWDRDDAMFLLNHVATDTTEFYEYSLSGDSWSTRPRLPVGADSAVALAAEPAGDWVLALVLGDSIHAWLYGYNRSQDMWVQKQAPTWNVATGEALTYSGTQAYALTGVPTTQPSWFWCYDPGFAAYWGRGIEGVAGKPLPVLRWQLTCAPNPLSARAVIRWQVPRLSNVSLKVYNAAGQMVSVLAQGAVKPGSYATTWSGCDQKGRRLAAGVYVCTLDGPGARITRKVVLTE